MSHTDYISGGAVLLSFMVVFYMFMGSLLEKYKIPIGHEASISIVVGILLSYLILDVHKDNLMELIRFNSNFFFYMLLPPLVFSTGYNMKRKAFFSNFGNILMLGLVNTCIQFALFTAMTYFYFQWFAPMKFNVTTG